jgi:hypothetical protein
MLPIDMDAACIEPVDPLDGPGAGDLRRLARDHPARRVGTRGFRRSEVCHCRAEASRRPLRSSTVSPRLTTLWPGGKVAPQLQDADCSSRSPAASEIVVGLEVFCRQQKQDIGEEITPPLAVRCDAFGEQIYRELLADEVVEAKRATQPAQVD